MGFKDLSLGKKITLAGWLFIMPIFIVCVLNMYKVRSMQQLYLSLDEVYRALSSEAADAHSHFLIAITSSSFASCF